MGRVRDLADALLQDRRRRQDNKPKPTRRRIDGADFDPFAFTRWRAVAGGDRGHLARSSMQRSPVGWSVDCQRCRREFESKGWACCPKCMELPAEERRANRKAVERLPRQKWGLFVHFRLGGFSLSFGRFWRARRGAPRRSGRLSAWDRDRFNRTMATSLVAEGSVNMSSKQPTANAPFRLEMRRVRDIQIPLVDGDHDFDFGYRCHPLEPDGSGDWFIFDDSRQFHTMWARRCTDHIAAARLSGRDPDETGLG
jgi:hypothetical protein